MKTLIFVDIDGVMTSMEETPGSYLNHLPDEYGLSDNCVMRLLNLCDWYGAHVVISSNWRNHDASGVWPYNGYDYPNPLQDLKTCLGRRYLDTLPAVRHKSKSEVVRQWFDANGLDPAEVRYVIFDDDDIREKFSASEFAANFVHTDFRIGLSDSDCLKAEHILDAYN